jgi:tetratricopeptide (TPR) repeat protein
MRAQLHERFAEWLQHVTAARALEFEELVGYHLEQASIYLSELGPLDEHGKALTLTAAERLAAAGANANTRGDMPAAASFLERAMALRREGDPIRLELAVDLAEAFREMGEFKKAQSVVIVALSAADPNRDERQYTALRLAELLLERLTRPAGWVQVAQEQAERAITVFEKDQDHVGLARAWRLLGTIHGTSLRYASAQQAVQHAVEEARLAGNRREETWSLPALALCALHGPEPVAQAIPRCERLVEEASGDRRAQALILAVLAMLCAMSADFTRARANYRRARAMLEDLGDRLQGAGTSLYAARVELLAENAAEAEARLRPDYELLKRMGERNFVPTAAAYLGDAAYLRGHYDEAEALSRVSEQTASPSDVESQYRWRCVRATLLAHSGETEEAVKLANAALALVLPIDSPAQQAYVYSVLANVLSQAGDQEGSERALRRAADLSRRQGDIVSTERVERIRSRLLTSRTA